MAHLRDSIRFTLIELLVVITIIAILASMLLPSLSRAKDIAKRSLCANNQKQLALAFLTYIDDYNQYYPPNNYSTVFYPEYGGAHIPSVLSDNGYIGTSRPNSSSREEAGMLMCTEDRYRENLKHFGYSYGYNHYIGAYYPVSTYSFAPFTMRSTVCGNPAAVLLFADSHHKSNWFLRIGTAIFPFDLTKGFADSDDYIPLWHANTAVISFLDGHAKSMTAKQISEQHNNISMITGGYW